MLPRMAFSRVLDVPSPLRPVIGFLFRVRKHVRPAWHWLSRYPVFAGITLLLLLISWGLLLDDFDAFHIVWHERFGPGFLGGATMALLLALFWYATYLIDRARAERNSRLLGSRVRLVYWRPYLVCWLVTLLLFILPSFGLLSIVALPGVETDLPGGARYYFPLGMLAVAVPLVVIILLAAGKERPHLVRWIGRAIFLAVIVAY